MQEPVTPIKKSSFLLKLIKIAAAIFISLVIIGILIGEIFGSKIKQLVVAEINKQLKVEVKVNGEIDFSVITNFPFASVSFNQVEVLESFVGSKSNLLETEKISLLFNLLDLWRGDYTIYKIVIGKGKLNIAINEKGEANYLILKQTADTSLSSVKIKIDEIVFTDLATLYTDDLHNQLYDFQIHNGTIQGEFESNISKLSLKASMLCRHLFISSDDYLQQKEMSISTQIVLNMKLEEYEFSNTKINIENFDCTINGKVKQKKQSTLIDFVFAGDKISIASFAGLLPEQYAKYISEYKSTGQLLLNGKVNGEFSNKKNPNVSIALVVKDATIKHQKSNATFEQVNFDAQFSNGINRNFKSSIINFKKASAQLNGKPLNFNLEIRNFIKPYIDVQINTVFNAADIYQMLNLPGLEKASGEIKLNKCFYSGPVSQLTASPDFDAVKSGGEILFTNCALKYNGIEYTEVNGVLKLENGNLNVEKLSAKTQTSDFNISGKCSRFLTALFNSSDKNKHAVKIATQLIFTADKLNVNEFNQNRLSEQSGESGETVIANLLEMITGHIQFKINHFKYDKFNAHQFSGAIVCKDQQIYFSNVSLNAEKGRALINAQLNFSNWNKVQLEGTFAGTDIDINQLFYEFNSWGQTEITDKNLKGILTTNLVLKAGWNKNEFDYDQLVVLADVDIRKGELNYFEPMKSLSAFVKISELENIRFSQLKNQIAIRNSTISFPVMNIYTNALNLEISGTHTFDNMIDYRIKLNMLQLLSNKLKNKNNFYPEALEQNKEGLLFLYVTMKGPAGDPIIKYDKKTVKEKIKLDVQLEKQNLKTILQQEFNAQNNRQEEIKDWQAPDEYEWLPLKDSTYETEELIFDDTPENQDTENSNTVKKQKDAFEQFKKSLQKKTIPPK